MPGEIIELFSTPIVSYRVEGTEDLNRHLGRTLLAERERDAGLSHSNVGGWHSQIDLPERPEPVFQALTALIDETFQSALGRVASTFNRGAIQAHWSWQGWAMVMERGDYSMVHDHADSDWSCVYYADAGEPADDAHPHSGVLAFVDPRPAVSVNTPLKLFPSTWTLDPEPGMVVFFPPWLKHYVHPYQGSRPRISISYNMKFESGA